MKQMMVLSTEKSRQEICATTWLLTIMYILPEAHYFKFYSLNKNRGFFDGGILHWDWTWAPVLYLKHIICTGCTRLCVARATHQTNISLKLSTPGFTHRLQKSVCRSPVFYQHSEPKNIVCVSVLKYEKTDLTSKMCMCQCFDHSVQKMTMNSLNMHRNYFLLTPYVAILL